jgi:hypothetical protein
MPGSAGFGERVCSVKLGRLAGIAVNQEMRSRCFEHFGSSGHAGSKDGPHDLLFYGARIFRQEGLLMKGTRAEETVHSTADKGLGVMLILSQ